jgi:hypothetical protein
VGTDGGVQAGVAAASAEKREVQEEALLELTT